jgi:cell wall-associated NlpC family hydrolase
MITAKDHFLSAAMDCVGARFRLQGRDPAYGLDCVGLISYCARAAGCKVVDKLNYDVTTDPAILACHLQESGFYKKEHGFLEPADVVIFSFFGSPNHAAISTASGIVHADMRLRKVVHHRLASSWRTALTNIYTLRESN